MTTPSEEQMQELVCHHAEKTFMFPRSDHHREHVRLHAVAAEMKAALTALQAENEALREVMRTALSPIRDYVDYHGPCLPCPPEDREGEEQELPWKIDDGMNKALAAMEAALTAKREEGGR